MAQEILEKFELAGYFDLICGATMDTSRTEKSQVIAYLLELTGGVEHAIMVGDTKFDVIGAAAHNMPTIGVSWGYGTVEEMQIAGAAAIANTTQELLELLNK
jgi:phosphoglycolate phosphatase